MDKEVSMKKLRKNIEKVQTAKRLEHTMGVEYTAACLAMKYGVSLTDARVAGLLHDCAKCMTDEELLKACKKNHYDPSAFEKRNPFILHGRVGAFLAKSEYEIEQEDILNAIAFHTTGRRNMSVLEKIIFIADYIEPGRNKAAHLEEIRKLAFEDLDAALIRILEDTLVYLKNSEGEIDPMTEITWKYYTNQL